MFRRDNKNPAMLTHYGIFLLCLSEKDALKTASSLRRVAQGVDLSFSSGAAVCRYSKHEKTEKMPLFNVFYHSVMMTSPS